MKPSHKLNLDKLGICTSTVCALHCLVTPFLILSLPFAGLAFLEWKELELGILALSFFFAIMSLVASYVRKHKNARPMMLAGFGFMLFIIGKVIPLEVGEIILSVLGGGFVVLAHYRNIVLTKQSALP